MRALYKSALLVGGLLLGSMAFAQKTQLLVYTALEVDQLKAYQDGFNKVHPDIDIKWVRDSTGVITAKLKKPTHKLTPFGVSQPQACP
jgi:iron(III) transport system substrate-binding protein